MKGSCELSCQQELEACIGICVDLRSDPLNCGECGQACAIGEGCEESKCVLSHCPAATMRCGGACVDPDNDRRHCGDCDQACGNGEVCVDGDCALACKAGYDECSGSCVDLQNDGENCGVCGNTCNTGICRGGQCLTVEAVSRSGMSACVVLSDGSVHCFGTGEPEVLGLDPSDPVGASPVHIEHLSGPAKAVAAGLRHVCALLRSGELHCWGANDLGQLGDGTTESRLEAAPVLEGPGSPLLGITEIVAGDSFTCALRESGEVVCWGANHNGQLGNGETTSPALYPTLTIDGQSSQPLEKVESLSADAETACALLEGGQVRCWGLNADYQVGNGTNQSPVRSGISPFGLTDVVQVSVSHRHGCALLSDGRVLCWGSNNLRQLGTGATSHKFTVPEELEGLETPAKKIAVGPRATCVILEDDTALCRGSRHQLGIGYTPSPSPAGTLVPILESSDEDDVLCCIEELVQSASPCAILQDGSIRCWGDNGFGEVGVGSFANPIPIPTPLDW